MALTSRLQSEAVSTGRSSHRLLQLVAFDRFLARIFHEFGSRAILKGGLVLELRVQQARTTRDIDLRVSGEEPEALLGRLERVGRMELGDFFSFVVEPDRRLPVLAIRGLPYEGRRFRVQAHLADRRFGSRFQVDVALAEPLVARPERVTARPLLEFAGVEPVEMWVYPVETHLAEKLHAYTLDRGRDNSRVKDLPDIALLAGVRGIDAEEFRRILQEVFRTRATHELPGRIPDPPDFWVTPYQAMALEDGLPWASVEDLTEIVRRFLDPVLGGAALGAWDPSSWAWSGAGEA